MSKPETAFTRGDRTIYDTTLGWRMINPRMEELYPPLSLGETAERVAERYAIDREEQDRFALRSHERAVQAQDSGRFTEEIVSVEVPAGRGDTASIEVDEGPRRDTSLEKLRNLKPAFIQDGTVTAGNSAQINDGASAVLLASRPSIESLGLVPLARFVDAATARVDPSYMGIGPVPATRKLLERVGMDVADIDVVELNEAFASQVLACVAELDIDLARVNPNGGSIAIGHPLGASGVRLTTTLAHEMQQTKKRFGLVTMCIGVGQGISALFEGVG